MYMHQPNQFALCSYCCEKISCMRQVMSATTLLANIDIFRVDCPPHVWHHAIVQPQTLYLFKYENATSADIILYCVII